MNKKIIITIIILIIFAGLGVGYIVFRKNNENETSSGASFLDNLFPFGEENGDLPGLTDATIPESPDGSPDEEEGGSVTRFRKIYEEPVAGVVLINKKDGVYARFVDRGTGHIYENKVDSPGTIKISNTTIPGIYESLWSPDGSQVILRYLREDNETIRTFSATIIASSSENTLGGIFLEDDLKHISLFGNKIFYFKGNQENFTGIISSLDGTNKVAMFESGFGDFISSWKTQNKITLITRPSASVGGYIYALNASNGSYQKIVDDLPGADGLLNNNGSIIFVSSGGNKIGSFATNLADSKTTTLSTPTIADKCVWSRKENSMIYCASPKNIPAGQYPDSWYQGLISFDDRLWKIDTETGQTELLLDPSTEVGEDMDITNLVIDEEDSFITFINKKDLSLWGYHIEI